MQQTASLVLAPLLLTAVHEEKAEKAELPVLPQLLATPTDDSSNSFSQADSA